MNTEQTVHQVIRGAGMLTSAPLEMKLIANLIARMSQNASRRGTGFLMLHEETLPALKKLAAYSTRFDTEYRQDQVQEGYQGHFYGMIVFTHDAIEKDAIYATEIGEEGNVIVSMGAKLIAQ